MDLRLLAGLTIVFALFQWSATALGSDRGQAGLIVGALVVAALFLVERLLYGRPFAAAFRELGFGPPLGRAIAAVLAISGVLLLTFPVYGAISQQRWSMVADWAWLAPGLFAQAGIGEEALFRGYLFGHLRRGRSFRRAALLSMAPFVVVHLWLFATMAWPVALAAVSLSVVMSLPLAKLFDLGGATIWAPAILHAVAQGAIKLLVADGPPDHAFPLIWMAMCAVVPILVFLVPDKSTS